MPAGVVLKHFAFFSTSWPLPMLRFGESSDAKVGCWALGWDKLETGVLETALACSFGRKLHTVELVVSHQESVGAGSRIPLLAVLPFYRV